MNLRILAVSLIPAFVLACSSDGGGNDGQAGAGNAAQGGTGGTEATGGTGATGGTSGASGATGGSTGTAGAAGSSGSTGGSAGTTSTGGSSGSTGGGAGTAGAGGSTGVALDSLAVTAANAVCGALFRCCNQQDVEDYFASYANDQELSDLGYADQLPPNAPLADQAACASILAEVMDIVPFGDWIDEAQAGHVSYDPDAAQTCVATLENAACGAEVSAALFDSACFGYSPPVGPAQRAVFTRTRGVGEACTPLRDGTGARFYGTCDPLVSFCCYENPSSPGGCAFPFDGDGNPRAGTCQAVAQEAEACSGGLTNVQLCKTGLDCDYDSGTCFAPGTASLQVGEDCIDTSFNLLGTCEDSWCDMTGSSKCEPYKADGENCVFANECESGACEGDVCGSPTYCTSP